MTSWEQWWFNAENTLNISPIQTLKQLHLKWTLTLGNLPPEPSRGFPPTSISTAMTKRLEDQKDTYLENKCCINEAFKNR